MEDNSSSSFINPELIAQIKKTELRLRKKLDTDFSGQFRSNFPGTGLIFKDLKEYEPGDDVKHIHWKATARSKKVFVKKYQEDRQINIFIILDQSNSQHFGQTKTKFEKSAEFSALVSYLGKINGDRVGICTFSENVNDFIPPTSKSNQFYHIMNSVHKKPKNTKKTDLSEAIKETKKKLNKKSIIFIISDFFTENFEDELKSLSYRNDCICVIANDKLEENFPNAALVDLVDLETGENFTVDSSSKGIKNLKTFQKERLAGIKKNIQKCGAEFIELKESPILALQNFMNRRR